MKKMVREIREWLREKAAERRQRERLARERAINDECEKELQVMEWNGDLYVCHGGVPIVKQDALKFSPEYTVGEGRETLKRWKGVHDERRKNNY